MHLWHFLLDIAFSNLNREKMNIIKNHEIGDIFWHKSPNTDVFVSPKNLQANELLLMEYFFCLRIVLACIFTLVNVEFNTDNFTVNNNILQMLFGL